jgi:UDP-N-acetylmuramoyl-tripeptide--D-alanyl-D-alanine ligase
MGANHVGEIEFLCSIAEPTHGLITSIGNAHLEGFGSIEGVQKGKGELFEYLKHHDGFAFVNADDFRVIACAADLTEKITYGFDTAMQPQIQFMYSIEEGDSGFTIREKGTDVEIHSSMFGHYNATNILAAYAVGKHFQVELAQMVESLSQFVPKANRSETIRYQGCVVVKDAYNANPTSMELALKSFSDQYPDGWILIGDMKELGTSSQQAHRHIIALVASLSFEKIFLIGEDFEKAFRAARLEDSRITIAKQIESLKSDWNWDECQGKTLLLKGSRSMHLENLLESPD